MHDNICVMEVAYFYFHHDLSNESNQVRFKLGISFFKFHT